jgi:hypothetical protein
MDQSSILGIVGIVIGISGTILALINHTRIRSNCFGKKIEVSLDVDKTIDSPPMNIKIPILPESEKESK